MRFGADFSKKCHDPGSTSPQDLGPRDPILFFEKNVSGQPLSATRLPSLQTSSDDNTEFARITQKRI